MYKKKYLKYKQKYIKLIGGFNLAVCNDEEEKDTHIFPQILKILNAKIISTDESEDTEVKLLIDEITNIIQDFEAYNQTERVDITPNTLSGIYNLLLLYVNELEFVYTFYELFTITTNDIFDKIIAYMKNYDETIETSDIEKYKNFITLFMSAINKTKINRMNHNDFTIDEIIDLLLNLRKIILFIHNIIGKLIIIMMNNKSRRELIVYLINIYQGQDNEPSHINYTSLIYLSFL